MGGIDDIGYETEKDDIESPLDNIGGLSTALPMLRAKTKTMQPNYGNPFQSTSYLKRMLSDNSDNDDLRLKISNIACVIDLIDYTSLSFEL